VLVPQIQNENRLSTDVTLLVCVFKHCHGDIWRIAGTAMCIHPYDKNQLDALFTFNLFQ